jgi:hypothetical protein
MARFAVIPSALGELVNFTSSFEVSPDGSYRVLVAPKLSGDRSIRSRRVHLLRLGVSGRRKGSPTRSGHALSRGRHQVAASYVLSRLMAARHRSAARQPARLEGVPSAYRTRPNRTRHDAKA